MTPRPAITWQQRVENLRVALEPFAALDETLPPKSWLFDMHGKAVVSRDQVRRAVVALLDAPPCNSTDVVSHDGADLKDNGWRPIASAPRDGTIVELKFGSALVKKGMWANFTDALDIYAWFPSPRSNEASDEMESLRRFGEPAHWRPLPSAPPHVAPETNVERDGGAS